MPRKRKPPTVLVTNPAFSSGKIPKPLGTFSPSPPPLAPITPKVIPASRQIVASKRVQITSRKSGV